MRRLYEGSEENDAGCPGEQNCDTWKSSAEDSPVRCPNCPKLSRESALESGAAEPETWDEKLLLDRVDRFAQERDSGRSVYELLQPLEWELLLIHDEAVSAWERMRQSRIAMALEAMMAITTRQAFH